MTPLKIRTTIADPREAALWIGFIRDWFLDASDQFAEPSELVRRRLMSSAPVGPAEGVRYPTPPLAPSHPEAGSSRADELQRLVLDRIERADDPDCPHLIHDSAEIPPASADASEPALPTPPETAAASTLADPEASPHAAALHEAPRVKSGAPVPPSRVGTKAPPDDPDTDWSALIARCLAGEREKLVADAAGVNVQRLHGKVMAARRRIVVPQQSANGAAAVVDLHEDQAETVSDEVIRTAVPFSTVSVVKTITVPAGVTLIDVGTGSGWMRCKRVSRSAHPARFQDASGAWFEPTVDLEAPVAVVPAFVEQIVAPEPAEEEPAGLPEPDDEPAVALDDGGWSPREDLEILRRFSLGENSYRISQRLKGRSAADVVNRYRALVPDRGIACQQRVLKDAERRVAGLAGVQLGRA